MGENRSGIILTLAASVLWGTSFLFIGLGLEFADPFTLVFLRFAVSSIIILIVSLLYKGLNLLGELRKPGIWVLGIANALGFLLQFIGQADSSAAESSLLSDLYPVIVPLLAFTLLKDRISLLQKLATLCGFVGLIIVMLPNLSFSSTHFLGDILLFLSAVCYAVFIVIGKKERISAVSGTFALMLVDTVLLVVPTVMFGHLQSIVFLGITDWLIILWLAVVCTLVATSLYLMGLRCLPASRSATVLFFELITGFILSVIVFGEPDLFFRWIGAAVISVSIILSSVDNSSESIDHSGTSYPTTSRIKGS